MAFPGHEHTCTHAEPARATGRPRHTVQSCGEQADVHTHERGTYDRRGKPCQARRVGSQVHTPERGACSPRLQGSSPCSLSNAKNVNNASALRSCITYSAPLPGRGRVPSRLMSPKPKSMAGWQHGLPAGGSEALWSKGVQGEERFRRDSCLRNPSPWPAGSMGCRRDRPRIPKPS
jgi:hypothetical protein